MSATRLFPIELGGSGTAQVESLPSYIHRVAWEHGVYVGELLRFIYKLGIRDSCIWPIVKLPQYAEVSELIRPNNVTSMIIRLLHTYTRQNLEGSVFWILQNDLARSGNEIVKGFRWCPECISEMTSLGGTAYFKLIWHLSAVSFCPIHRTPLIGACEFCGDGQTSYVKQDSIALCQQCGRSLSKRRARLKYSDIRYSWEDIGLDIVKLFEDLSRIRPSEWQFGGIKRSLEGLFDYYWRHGREDEIYDSLTRDQFLAILYEQTPINLKSARRIAYRLGISLFDLLSGNAAQTTESLDGSLFCKLPPGYLEVGKKTSRDHRAIINNVRVTIKDSETPLSLKDLARRVGVSVGYLQYRYPVLSKDVIKRYSEYQESEKMKRLQYAQKVALEFFVDEKYGVYRQSRKEAYRVLRAETGLPKFLLKRSIQSAYMALR